MKAVWRWYRASGRKPRAVRRRPCRRRRCRPGPRARVASRQTRFPAGQHGYGRDARSRSEETTFTLTPACSSPRITPAVWATEPPPSRPSHNWLRNRQELAHLPVPDRIRGGCGPCGQRGRSGLACAGRRPGCRCVGRPGLRRSRPAAGRTSGRVDRRTRALTVRQTAARWVHRVGVSSVRFGVARWERPTHALAVHQTVARWARRAWGSTGASCRGWTGTRD